MGYTAADLALAYQRAVDRGPKAAARFKAALNAAAFRLLHLGESEEEAFFDILGDDPKGRIDS